MATVGVCLSGCGVFDGAEIHEAVLTLLALDQAGAEVAFMAPNVEQADVVNHLTQEPIPGKTRNVLQESARIARGEIQDLRKVSANDLDALIFPGGFGAAKNLCTFAVDGPACTVEPEVERLVAEMLIVKKPLGALCIAPVLLARILQERGLSARMTIGNDPDTAAALEAMGCEHENCPASGIVVDERLRIVTTPAYMLAGGPAEVWTGTRALVEKVLELAAMRRD